MAIGTIADGAPSDAPLFPLDGMAKFFIGLLSPYLGAVFMETFLYGIYTILFGICIYVLLRRNKSLHWVLLVFAVLMFALASADVGYTFYLVFGKLLSGSLSFKSLYPKYVMFVTNGVLADTLLMYRCFVVWGRKKRVIFGPFLLLIATTVCGYLFEGASANLFKHAPVYLAMTLALNVILTVLTAGRIWYLRHQTRTLLADGLQRRYRTTLTILIESGVLYSTYMILDLAFQDHPIASTILDAGLIQIVGIMPTLIIVQVGLGRALYDMDTKDNLNSTIDPLSRIEANKASLANPSFVAVPNGNGGYGYYGPGYFRSTVSNSLHFGADDEESKRTSRALSEFTATGPYAQPAYGMGMRSAAVLSDATTTVDSGSELVLHISKANALKAAGAGVATESSRSVPEEVTVETWTARSKAKEQKRGDHDPGSAGNFTPAPQRRSTRRGAGGSLKSSIRKAHHQQHEHTSSDASGHEPTLGHGYQYHYPTSTRHRNRTPEEEEEHRDFSVSKRTLFNEEIVTPPAESYEPHASTAYYHPANTRSPTTASPLSSPGSGPLRHHRQYSTPPPPGISISSSPTSPVGASSPLSRLVEDIARPKPAMGGYFDSSLSAAWGQPRWNGASTGTQLARGGLEVPDRSARAPSSSFPVPVSIGPSRASSINESSYSPI